MGKWVLRSESRKKKMPPLSPIYCILTFRLFIIGIAVGAIVGAIIAPTDIPIIVIISRKTNGSHPMEVKGQSPLVGAFF